MKRYPSQNFTITYDASRCIGAGECAHGLRDVFNPDARPWINPDRASAEQVAPVVCRCPTGALHLETTDPQLAEKPDAENTITLSVDGALYCRGDIRIVTKSGEVLLTDTRVALCRCGMSAHKPLCDNAHKNSTFSDAGSPAPEESSAAEIASGGPLTITPSVNGPLRVTGNVCIKDSFGDPIFKGTEAYLCRCGGSNKKPFCDGTHKKIGFTS